MFEKYQLATKSRVPRQTCVWPSSLQPFPVNYLEGYGRQGYDRYGLDNLGFDSRGYDIYGASKYGRTDRSEFYDSETGFSDCCFSRDGQWRRHNRDAFFNFAWSSRFRLISSFRPQASPCLAWTSTGSPLWARTRTTVTTSSTDLTASIIKTRYVRSTLCYEPRSPSVLVNQWSQGRNEVRWRPGQNQVGAPMFKPKVFWKQIYYSEENTCDIVGTFRRPPYWFGARGPPTPCFELPARSVLPQLSKSFEAALLSSQGFICNRTVNGVGIMLLWRLFDRRLRQIWRIMFLLPLILMKIANFFKASP